ncbi:MAG: DUF1552 domain-containing protein [Myxococcota bacterium]
MRRRDFVAGSLKAAALLSPLASLRTARAQAPQKRVVFWVCSTGYPDPRDFFPDSTFELTPMLSGFAGLEDRMTIVDGISIRQSGPGPRANHLRSQAKVLTAKNALKHPSNRNDLLPGGVSVDQLIARELGLQSIELLVSDRDRQDTRVRLRPFATGPQTFKTPFLQPRDAWRRVFQDFSAPAQEESSAGEARARAQARLFRRRSILDSVASEFAGLRSRLNAREREKLDVHEDAIRRAELSIASDLEALSDTPLSDSAECVVPGEPASGGDIPSRSNAHLELMVAALACNRVQVGGVCFGWSGYKWSYSWVPNVSYSGNIHDQVHHKARNERDNYVRAARWDWSQLANFARRLDAIPEGEGTMLDHTLVVGLSHFGLHHEVQRLPAVLLGGGVTGRRHLRVGDGTQNDQLLTSVAHWMGLPISGIGDDPQCGPLPQFLS